MTTTDKRNGTISHDRKQDLKNDCITNDEPMTIIQSNLTDSPVTVSQKAAEHHKKPNFMSKILLRLTKPHLFVKEKRSKKAKTKKPASADCTQQSPLSDNNSHHVVDTLNHVSPRSKSFRSIFSKFGKKKVTSNRLSEPPSSVESRPSVSSTVNTAVQVESRGSCQQECEQKICKDVLEKFNSSLVHYSIGDNTGKLKSKEIELLCSVDDDKLSPLNINSNLTVSSIDRARSHHAAMSVNNTDTSSNVRLTLSLYGYTTYELKSSRFSSKSCMEFRSSCMSSKSKFSMDNIVGFTDKSVTLPVHGRYTNEAVNQETVPIEDNATDTEVEPMNVARRKTDRPHEINLRSRGGSQTSVRKSSLIMVAVSQNSPRIKGMGSQATSPCYGPESPSYSERKWEFEDDSRVINDGIAISERNGNDFLIIADQYEAEINAKIDIVQRYLECHGVHMNDDVIGELNTAVGLAKLLLSEKFVQFRGLCNQNINESDENEFKTLPGDLEGYLTTLEIQMADLNRNFQLIEVIRENKWQFPESRSPERGSNTTKKKVKPRVVKTNLRSLEAKQRIAEYKKICAANNQVGTNMLVIQ